MSTITMSMSALCEVCKAINNDEVSQMFAARLLINIPEEAILLLGMAAREISEEPVRDWALNELTGVFNDDNSS